MLGVSPALLERYLSAAAKISALAVGEPEDHGQLGDLPRPRRCIADRASRGRCRSARAAALLALHTFPLDGEYVIKVKLLETNLGSIRGLEDEHQLEIAVDGGRVLLAPVGGPDDYTQSSRNATNVVNALDDAAAGARDGQARASGRSRRRFCRSPRRWARHRLQPFLRSTLIATDHLGLPHVENMTVSAGRSMPPAPATRQAGGGCSSCRPAKRPHGRTAHARRRSSRRWRAARIGGR